MSYINRQLLTNETVVFRTSKHWIIFLPTIIWLVLAIICYRLYAIPYAQLIPFVITFVMFIYNGIEYLFSEYAITNQRVLMKEGFVWRRSIETVLSSVSRSELHQTLMGRILGYGRITICGFGGSNGFSQLNKSAQFQKHLQERLSDLVY